MKKKKERSSEKEERIVVIDRPYQFPKNFDEFRNQFGSEVKRTLEMKDGKEPDMILVMEQRIKEECESAKSSIGMEHDERCRDIGKFRTQCKKEEKKHRGILDGAKDELKRKEGEYASLLESSNIDTSKPWWAAKWMIALMSVVFMTLDSYLFFIFTKEMNINAIMKIGVAILLGALITVVPILIGHSYDRWTSELADINTKEKYMRLTIFLVIAFFILFISTVILRFMFSGILMEDENDSRSFALSLLFAIVPLVTGIATAYISYEDGNIVRNYLIELKRKIEELKETILEEDAKLVEYEDLDNKIGKEIEEEGKLFQDMLDRIEKECEVLHTKLRTI